MGRNEILHILFMFAKKTSKFEKFCLRLINKFGSTIKENQEFILN